MSKKNKRKGAAQDRTLAAERHENWLRSQPHYVVADSGGDHKQAPNAEMEFKPVKPFRSVDQKYADLWKTEPLPDDQYKGSYRLILERMPPGTKVFKGAEDHPIFISPLQPPGA